MSSLPLKWLFVALPESNFPNLFSSEICLSPSSRLKAFQSALERSLCKMYYMTITFSMDIASLSE